MIPSVKTLGIIFRLLSQTNPDPHTSMHHKNHYGRFAIVYLCIVCGFFSTLKTLAQVKDKKMLRVYSISDKSAVKDSITIAENTFVKIRYRISDSTTVYLDGGLRNVTDSTFRLDRTGGLPLQISRITNIAKLVNKGLIVPYITMFGLLNAYIFVFDPRGEYVDDFTLSVSASAVFLLYAKFDRRHLRRNRVGDTVEIKAVAAH
jgi:hypothetical protein